MPRIPAGSRGAVSAAELVLGTGTYARAHRSSSGLMIAARSPLPSHAAPAHTPTMSMPLKCRLQWHSWKRMTNDDNEVYRACSRCGKVDDDYFPPASGASVG